ncbi:Low-density lipoprotein receptor-related protein 1B [Amphibalanus amphitrite]|uniref:Low-density lipoprotein receptor-related protein 1B n=1 Tax=Amphibalanus amphitrite TaxID=1232801 RepID=A0A6A4VJ13_AMPAM|nr:Low-density lipoprotein receptor-related protein 1B [Amphibalanus amphitrite]
MTGESASRTPIITAAADMADLVVAVSMTGDEFQDRTLWLDRTSRSVYSQPSAALELWSEDERTTLLTHPSLEHAGGLGRLVDDRLFWTDTSTGTLWSVDALKEGAEPRALAEVPGGRALRLLHPWTQPAASEPVCGPGALQCSQLCLRTVGYFHSPSAECACADGLQLADDGKTCELD